MKHAVRQPELLAPAGSLEAAKAAVNAGADAVYMGGPLFSARAYAESSSEDMLLEAIRYCHLRDVKVYMTLNTLMKEREMEELFSYLLPYYKAGLDAVIVQDLGVLMFLRQHFPDLAIHASTQMTVTGRHSAELLRRLGVTRIVTARELSLAEIRDIHEHVDIEIESFIHGAMCYCYSGQCLMSSVIGGRSGNRGRCAGPCRLPYRVYDEQGKRCTKEPVYVLSMKDFNTLPDLKAMTEAGVTSLKIEGRMKSPLYVAAVTAAYRKYLDQGMPEQIDPEDEALLREVFDRGGSTDGYLWRQNGRDMIALSEKESRIPEEARLAPIRKRYLEQPLRLPVELYGEFVPGEPARLTMRCRYRGIDQSFQADSGEQKVLEAERQPLSEERIRESLLKLGNTDFTAETITIRREGEVFFPIREINELRRKAADGLTACILAGSSRDQGTGAGIA